MLQEPHKDTVADDFPPVTPKNLDEVPIGSSDVIVGFMTRSIEPRIFITQTHPDLYPAPKTEPAIKNRHISWPIAGVAWGPKACELDNNRPHVLEESIRESTPTLITQFNEKLQARMPELLIYHAIVSHGLEIVSALQQANKDYAPYAKPELWKPSKHYWRNIDRFIRTLINDPAFADPEHNYRRVTEFIIHNAGSPDHIRQWQIAASDSIGKEFNLMPEEVVTLAKAQQSELPALLSKIAPVAAQRYLDQTREHRDVMLEALKAHYELQKVPENLHYRPALTREETRQAAQRYVDVLFNEFDDTQKTAPARRFARQGFNHANVKLVIVPGDNITAFTNFNGKEYRPAGAQAAEDGTLTLPDKVSLRVFSHELAHAYIHRIYSGNKHRPWSDKLDPRKQLWKEALEADTEKQMKEIKTDLHNILQSQTVMGEAMALVRKSEKNLKDTLVEIFKDSPKLSFELHKLKARRTLLGRVMHQLHTSDVPVGEAVEDLLTKPVGYAWKVLQEEIGFDDRTLYNKGDAARESIAYIIDKMAEGEWHTPHRFNGQSLASRYPHLTAFVKDVVFPDGEYFAKHGTLRPLDAQKYRHDHPRHSPTDNTRKESHAAAVETYLAKIEKQRQETAESNRLV